MRRFKIRYENGVIEEMDDLSLALNSVEYWLNHRAGDRYIVFLDREYEILTSIEDIIDFTELCEKY